MCPLLGIPEAFINVQQSLLTLRTETRWYLCEALLTVVPAVGHDLALFCAASIPDALALSTCLLVRSWSSPIAVILQAPFQPVLCAVVFFFFFSFSDLDANLQLQKRPVELWGADVAQLVERRTGTPLRQVWFPSAGRDFCSRVIFQCRLS